MSEKKEVELVVIKEGIIGSIVTDASTFGGVAGLIGLGVLLESDAMQWFGFVMAAFVLVGRGMGAYRKMPRFYSVKSAIEYLQKMEDAA